MHHHYVEISAKPFFPQFKASVLKDQPDITAPAIAALYEFYDEEGVDSSTAGLDWVEYTDLKELQIDFDYDFHLDHIHSFAEAVPIMEDEISVIEVKGGSSLLVEKR